MSEEKESSKLTLEQIEMLVVFSHASEDYPDLSFEEVALKLLGPEPFKPTPNGKQFESNAEKCLHLTPQGTDHRTSARIGVRRAGTGRSGGQRS
jgi:hypothetical protein